MCSIMRPWFQRIGIHVITQHALIILLTALYFDIAPIPASCMFAVCFVYVFYRSHSSSSSFYFLFTFFYFLHSLRIKIYIIIIITSKSSINTRNERGPNREPCDIAPLSCDHLEQAQFFPIRTRCDLFCRQEMNHLNHQRCQTLILTASFSLLQFRKKYYFCPLIIFNG